MKTPAVLTAVLPVALLVLLMPCTAAPLVVSAIFTQNGITGNITFSQWAPTLPTTITVSLYGLDADTPYLWHVNQYPSSLGQPYPCTYSVAGDLFDPLGVGQLANYTGRCGANQSLCQIGDLTGRHGPLTGEKVPLVVEDKYLDLYSTHSVVGRSVVLGWKEAGHTCANIGYPVAAPSQTNLYAPFRVGFAGAVYFRPYASNVMTTYVDLYVASDDGIDLEEHGWLAYALVSNRSDCTTALGNTTQLLASNGSVVICDTMAQEICEAGDLTGRASQLDIYDGMLRAFYVDIDSPSAQVSDIYGVNSSIFIVMINETKTVEACIDLMPLITLEAVAEFDMMGVVGTIRFNQATPFERTVITVDLIGFSHVPLYFGVHELNVLTQGEAGCSSAGEQLSNASAVSFGEHLQESAGHSDNVSLRGPLAVHHTYSSTEVFLHGKDSSIGRSVMIYFENRTNWVCANILHRQQTLQSVVHIDTGWFTGSIRFIQPVGDPFAATTVTVDVRTYQSDPTSVIPSSPLPLTHFPFLSADIVAPPSVGATFSNELHTSPFQGWTTLPHNLVSQQVSEFSEQGTPSLVPSPIVMVRKREAADKLSKHHPKRQATEELSYIWSIRCASNSSNSPVFSPYGPSRSACSPDNQLMCAVGDLERKHGTLKSGRTVFTDVNLPLAGPYSIIGSSLCIQTAIEEPGVCVTIPSTSLVAAPADVRVLPTSLVTTSSPVPSPPNSTVHNLMVSPTESASTLPLPTSWNMIPLLAGCVAGGIAAIFLTIISLALVCYCRCCQSTKYAINQSGKGRNTSAELGAILKDKPEPQLGVPCYRALHNYKPINQDDLHLRRGDVVTLLEASSSGEWWKGTIGDQSGWFPKICLEYFDQEVEKRAQQRVGIFTPKGGKKNILTRSFRRTCGMADTPSGDRIDPAASDGRPGSPESMSEVITNTAASGSPQQVGGTTWYMPSEGGTHPLATGSNIVPQDSSHVEAVAEMTCTPQPFDSQGIVANSSGGLWNGAHGLSEGRSPKLCGVKQVFDNAGCISNDGTWTVDLNLRVSRADVFEA